MLKYLSSCMPVEMCMDCVDYWLKYSLYTTGTIFSSLVATLCFVLIGLHGTDHKLNMEVENPLRTLRTIVLTVC